MLYYFLAGQNHSAIIVEALLELKSILETGIGMDFYNCIHFYLRMTEKKVIQIRRRLVWKFVVPFFCSLDKIYSPTVQMIEGSLIPKNS